jgi:hypothetical protein
LINAKSNKKFSIVKANGVFIHVYGIIIVSCEITNCNEHPTIIITCNNNILIMYYVILYVDFLYWQYVDV